MNLPSRCFGRLFAVALLSATAFMPPRICAAGELRDTSEPPMIPIGYDAFLQWERWPMLRLGVRAYMRSTFDRTGGNHFADAAHYIRQLDDRHSVALDEQGPGILWFVRHNHWHGSPWSYTVDGREMIVQESSTADPTKPVENSVFLPKNLFPAGLTYTWSVTKGADLSWVPIPFEKNLQIAYGRTRYGTGYFILWKLMPGLTNVSRVPGSWTTNHVPPKEVLELLRRSGTDIAPPPSECFQTNGTVSLAAHESRTLVNLDGTPSTLRRLAFHIPEKSAEAFRQARLRIWWDGRSHPSVDAPAGFFFGTASLMRDEGQEFIVNRFR
jgi:D-arabinan exo alpha-(1,3)/(1,5)-arabinofuranosidase (non-reducing end)